MTKKPTKNKLTIEDYESVNSNAELLHLIERKEKESISIGLRIA